MMVVDRFAGWWKKEATTRQKIFWISLILIFFLTGVLYWRWLPDPLFRDPSSTVITDREGRLLGARLATDQQWRFPESEEVPEKFRIALMHYEDRYFNFHPGFNPVSLIRAAMLNFRNHRVVSGGSTLTMQVIRLARKNRERTYGEKFKEILLAFRLELGASKREILRLYVSHAPFGGNVIGLEAAAWRYFGVPPDRLSWAEAATLAVLPNSPGMIYPGRNQSTLLSKRNRLLDILLERSVIDRATWELARSEKLPGKPFPLPQKAPHLLDRLVKEGHQGQRLTTTLDGTTQDRTSEILLNHRPRLVANEIYNAAVLIVEVATGNVLCYCGNLPRASVGEIENRIETGNSVDIITSPRSTGSILKPFLYAAMLTDGLLLPNTLVPDIPMQIGGFIPENYNLTYDGAVPAKQALSRSLNIPAVKMLQTYGYPRFYALLRKAGMTTLTHPAGHYGLSLILGGAEATLWDLVGLYASMARTLQRYNSEGPTYSKADFHPLILLSDQSKKTPSAKEQASWFDAGSIWLTFEAMVEVSRPDEEQQWQSFSSSRKIAWKTGTSFGNRDAWSVGVTPEYVVGVWVGNASGEGRPGLTGISMAAPVLFDVFKALPPSSWFGRPDPALVQAKVCRYSGYRASSICEFTDSVWIPKSGMKTPPCPFHQMVHLDPTGKWQVHSGCEAPEKMLHLAWFVLPPVQEWYFRNKNPFYKPLPPFKPGCETVPEHHDMEIIYPGNNSRIFIPVDLDGKAGYAIVKVAHRNPKQLIYWHLDDQFIGTTNEIHQMAISPESGIHRLTLVDQTGERVVCRFEVITNENR